jgi:hypothetical protein
MKSGAVPAAITLTSALDPQCFIVRDAHGQQIAYIYYESEPGRRSDEARPIAAIIAKLPKLLRKLNAQAISTTLSRRVVKRQGGYNAAEGASCGCCFVVAVVRLNAGLEWLFFG